MDSWNAKLSELIEAHTAALVGSASGIILSRAGMAEILERMRIYQVLARPNLPQTPALFLADAFPLGGVRPSAL
jgi:hypothetical protein